MTLTEIAQHRYTNQQLAGSSIRSAVKMVEWFGGVQGQEYAQTKWGIGLRLANVTDVDIEKELNEGKILRTHLLRPTWHFVSAKDIRWLLELTAPRVHQANAYMYRQLELDQKVFKRCNEVLVKILEGKKTLTRDELNETFSKKKILAKGHRLSYLMMNAELEGLVCSGPRKGNQFTYALLDERVKQEKSLEKEDALAELTKIYFRSRGPATAKDFATWSGLTLTDCKKGLELMKPALEKVVTEKQEYFSHPGSTSTKQIPSKIHLLPVYDELIMGYKNRSAIMTLKGKAPFRYDSMVVSGGQVIGTWRRTVSKNVIEAEVDFFKPLSKNQTKEMDIAVKRLAGFTGLEINIS